MRGNKALEYLSAAPWAIRPELMEIGRSILLGEVSADDKAQAVRVRDGRLMEGTNGVQLRDGVAVIDVIGPIFRYSDRFIEMCGGATVETLAKDLKTALDNGGVRAVLLNVDSPGGQAAGIGELAEMIRAGTSRKPIVAYVGSEACSAGYWLAAAASEIVVAPTGIVGSIGAVMAYPRKKNDPRSVEFVASQSPLKRPDVDTEEGRAEVQRTVDSLAQVFVESVATYRGLTPEAVLSDFGQGGLRIGAEAVSVRMADRLGSFEGVLAQLAAGYAPKTPHAEQQQKKPATPPSPAIALASASKSPASNPKGSAAVAATVPHPSKGTLMNWFTSFFKGAVAALPDDQPVDVEGIKALASMGDPKARLAGFTAELKESTINIDEHPEVKALKARLATAETAAKAQAEASIDSFVASLIKGEHLLPAQAAGAKSLLVQLSADDAAQPLATGSRLKTAQDLLSGNHKHGLTTEVVTEDGSPKLPPGHKVVASSHDGKDSKAVDKARINELMAMTDEGKAILARSAK